LLYLEWTPRSSRGATVFFASIHKSLFMPYYTYILASKKNGTLYIGSTSNLLQRIWQHNNKLIQGFTSQYDVVKLVHFEEFNNISDMAQRERRLKEWKRSWKIDLIMKENPEWQDLFYQINQ
jgi:putative endonuclease